MTSARAYLGACGGLIGFALFYALPIYAHLPHNYYDPVAHRWFFAANATPIPMGYVGQIVWGIGGALIGAGATMMVIARKKQPLGDRAFALGAAWTLTALAVVLGYFTWNNWP